MDQFVVRPLFGDGPVHWYTITNATLWMLLCAVAVIGLLVLGTRGRAIIPNRLQSVAELIYGLIHKMIEDIAGKEGLRYFPYIMTLFLFI
ncbi:MAG: F0F1 ATP synthase subunit A, partial [Paracoccus sp. (in: a-proteobacteria)]|nr:F0F1 ATP synthase subunit A [Paracoccus sp. (in: a-proteobacteria)]